jgi:hypothetical protein
MHTTVILDTDTGEVTIGTSGKSRIMLSDIDTLIRYLDMAGTRLFDRAGIMVYKITLEGIELAIAAALSHTKG